MTVPLKLRYLWSCWKLSVPLLLPVAAGLEAGLVVAPLSQLSLPHAPPPAAFLSPALCLFHLVSPTCVSPQLHLP